MTLEALRVLVRKWDFEMTGSPSAKSEYGFILDQLDYHATKEWRLYLPAEHPDFNPSYMERLAAWIGNVTVEEDQKLLLKYASHISFFSHDDFAALYRTAMDREITRWVSSQKQWHFIGAIGTEERSLCSWAHMRNQGVIAGDLFAEVQDVDSEKYRDLTRSALDTRRSEFDQLGGNFASVVKMDLMSELFLIDAFTRRAESAGPSIVLDITSLPKRFFFPILRRLVNSPNVRNLLVTYTSPASYAPDSEPLYEDIEPWRVLPGFGGSGTSGAQWVVSVGFLVESLRMYVGGNPNEKMKLLIPFPAPLSAMRRTSEAVANLEGDQSVVRFEKFRVETLDMSAAFDRICSLAGNPEKLLAFAPFGPKPTSAAMCLYAMQKDSSVHYSQPTVYHPHYSRGIRNNDPAIAVSAYWIKHDGENLYAI